ncbi:helix-turn-helix transcriptional regulator [Streptomyces sp.]|uniref:helix-turn-helix transcriptional regulator n=1 Tax=Streptomyces sp. TaxID=1931 RepID=UPI002F3F9BB6
MDGGRSLDPHGTPAVKELVGRERELARISEALAPKPAEGRLLALLGEPGIGKSLLMRAVHEEATERGVRVLRARGSSAESDLAFAGLHQLLGPALPGVCELPAAQRDALDAAFGVIAMPAPPDPMVLRLGVLTLLSRLADGGPLLLLVDDLQWLDAASSDVLAFLARRLEGEPIGLFAAARGHRLPPRLEGVLPTLTIGPLDPVACDLLLDRQAIPFSRAQRQQILEQAAGNPLALLELALTLARGDRTGGALPALAATERLESAFIQYASELPGTASDALLVAAAADTSDLAVIVSALPASISDPYEVWRPAEEAGLVRLRDGRLEFRHPLVRSALYRAASYSARRQAHLRLARAETDPDRRAWHLSAGTVAPDEEVAALVQAAAERARRRGAVAEAVAGFERAGQLSPDPREHGRRLGIASLVAAQAGQVDQARELAHRAAELTDDPDARARLAELAALVALLTMRLDEAMAQALLSAAADSGPDGPPRSILGTGAQIAYYSGSPEFRERLGALLPRDRPASVQGSLARWAVDPYAEAETVRAALPGMVAALHGDPAEQHLLAALAQHVDTGDALGLLDAVADPQRDDSDLLHGGLAAADRAWARFESGNWRDALASADRIGDARCGRVLPLAACSAQALRAALAALTGDTERARELARRVIGRAETAQVRALLVRAHWANALADLADGEPDAAYPGLRALFEEAGDPVHYHQSPYYVADLAAAAVRTGRSAEAMAVLNRVRAVVGGGGSPRLRRVLCRAQALLAPEGAEETEELFRAAVAEPAEGRWPFEQALVLLEYGEWLRRRRRIGDARVRLGAALRVFERLGAEPWAQRASGELRASGVVVRPAEEDALAGFSPRTQEILRLAAQGLTNPQIGERLYLSPRTVASHLYRSFPKLGITLRSQLRDLIPPETD